MTKAAVSRRHAVAILAAAGLSPAAAAAQDGAMVQNQPTGMPVRRHPVTGEAIPVIGLGSSKMVSQISTMERGEVVDVINTLIYNGGKVIDTWPRDPANDAIFGEIISMPGYRNSLFVTTKIDREGREAGLAQFDETMGLYKRDVIDLAQIFSLTDLYTHWPTLKDLKSAGRARYIGVTVSNADLYDPLTEFLSRETPDFIQVNYSVTERGAEETIIPMARDKGVAVIVNRPFMNGDYFKRLEGRPLPPWAAYLGCTSWAQFSLKYILANPDITCILTETSNYRHMKENAETASGPVPDDVAKDMMRNFIDQV